LRSIYGNLFVTSISEVTGTVFNFAQPLEIEWSTSLEFIPSITTPPSEQLEQVLFSAFEGSGNAQYLAVIQGLPSANIFSTAQSIVLVRNASGETVAANRFSTMLTDNSSILVAAAAGAGLLAFLVGGVAVHRRRRANSDLDSRKHGGHTLHSDSMTGSISSRPSYRTAVLSPGNTDVDEDKDIQELGDLHEVDLTL